MFTDILGSSDSPDNGSYVVGEVENGHNKNKTNKKWSKSFGLIFFAVKGLRVLALFLAYDLFKGLHLIPALFIIQVISSVFLVLRQKPFTSGPRLTFSHWSSIVRCAILNLLVQLIWFYGLTLCGPLRTILVTEHLSSALLAGILAVFCQSGDCNPAKSRGAVLYLMGTLSLLFIDHDDNSPHHKAYHAGHAGQHQEIYTFFTHMFGWTDISDHKGGVLLLSGLLLSMTFIKWYNRKVSAVVGGTKRLYALTNLIMGCALLPWALFHKDTLMLSLSTWKSVFTLVFVALILKVADFYADIGASQRQDREKMFRFGSFCSFGVAFVIGSVWTQTISFGVSVGTLDSDFGQVDIVEDHQLSPGVIIAAFLFALASLNLTSTSNSGTRGLFVGYSASGLPLYNLSSGSLHDASQSIMRTIRQEFKQIVDNPNSRRIFYFLLLNLFFTFVEFAYGIWTNSLGLISDGFHMLFDCSALVMGLYASVLSKWKPTKTFSFGYDRFETLSGFVNGLFLAIIAMNVFFEAISRLIDPPTVGTEKLLAVSVAGLVVNLIGIFSFSQSQHGHSHEGGSHGHSHNINMEGVFLHILADTLGSVGVIISSLLIQNYDFFIADPICSLFIAIMIFLSVLPLLRQSAMILLLAIPPELSLKLHNCLENIERDCKGIKSIQKISVWTHTNEKIHANITVRVEDGTTDGQTIAGKICFMLKEVGINFPVVQIEKDKFETFLEGMETHFVKTFHA